MEPVLLRCPQCGVTWELEAARLPPEGAVVQCGRCRHVFPSNGNEVARVPVPNLALLAEPPPAVAWRPPSYVGLGGHATGVRIMDNPLRAPLQRAWLERTEPDDRMPVVQVLEGPRVVVGRDPSAGVVVPDLSARPIHLLLHGDGPGHWSAEAPVGAGVVPSRLVPGARLLVGHSWFVFGASGALAVRAHQSALDQTPLDEHAWLVWADQLKEQADPLGDFLCERRHSEPELAEQLGALEPLARRGLVGLTWNRFGFLSGVSLSVDVLRQHRFVLDVAWVPAVRHLATLTITGQVDVDQLAGVLRGRRLPRSLQALRFDRGAPPDWLVEAVRQQAAGASPA